MAQLFFATTSKNKQETQKLLRHLRVWVTAWGVIKVECFLICYQYQTKMYTFQTSEVDVGLCNHNTGRTLGGNCKAIAVENMAATLNQQPLELGSSTE